MKKVELALRKFGKLKMAVLYGADAVYLAGKNSLVLLRTILPWKK